MEKRQYQRENIDCLGLFYIQGGEYGKIEFDGIVINVSEGGMAIKVVKSESLAIADEVQVGTELKFCFIDRYELFHEIKDVNVSGMATVVWIDKNDERLIIGCEFHGDCKKLERYVAERKMITFMAGGYHLFS